MSKFTDFYKKYLAGLNKYWLVTIFFMAVMFLFGDSNLYNRFVYNEKIRSLESEINKYQKEIEQNKAKLHEILTDKDVLEKFAREEYLMKKENEDIFIFEE
jgi:cell division protein FtsB